MTHFSAPEDAGALWLHTLQRAMSRASHDVKDAINGVSVNLEVIRSRAERADLPASSVLQFAEGAGNQLERLTMLTDAVLSLGRAERDPVDVAATLRRVAVVCSASASANDAVVAVREDGLLGSTLSKVEGSAVRLALMAPLLDAIAGTDRTQQASEIGCTVESGADGVVVRMSAEGRRLAVPELVSETLRAAGIRWTEDGQSLSLTFPRA